MRSVTTIGLDIAKSVFQVHGVDAHGEVITLAQTVPIDENYGGLPVWQGTVHVFDLEGSPSGANRAYAWSYERPDGKRRFFAVLHMGGITGPVEAVRAAIVAEQRAAK